MRKKSHLSLAVYLIDNMDSSLLINHRKAFLLGSILPDCRPSFVTTKHNMEETFDMVSDFISQLTVDSHDYKRISTAYVRKLGEVKHYVADYFTYPHNEVFDGNIKDHCIYEKNLKEALKSYIDSEQIYINKSLIDSFRKPEDICRLIKNLHAQYVSGRSTVNNDCIYIVAMCHIIVGGILKLLIENRSYGYINRLRPNVA